MERESRFWKALHKANALLFFLLVCVIAAGCFFMFVSLFGESRTPDRPEITLEGESDADTSHNGWFLGRSTLINGTNYVRIPLQSEPPDSSGRLSSGGYYASRGDVRNYLFTNSDSRSAVWLFPTNGQLISSAIALQSTNGSAAVGVLYLVVRKDTNGDGKLSGDDLKDLGYSETSGLGYSVLVEGIDGLNGAHVTQGGGIIFFYLKEKSGYEGQFTTTQPEKLVVRPLPTVQ